MRLAELQATMFSWVVSDAPVDARVEALVHGGALSPATRVGLYAEMYWLRHVGVLREHCPHVRTVLGDEAFDVLAARYLAAHPSTSADLGRFGLWLGAFLDEHPVPGLPWLGSLARLELARVEAFVAPDGEVLEPGALAALGPESFPHARLTAGPSVRHLALTHDVTSLWRALEAGQPHEAVPATPVHLLVWRQGVTVFHAPMSEAEAAALDWVLTEADLPTVCAAFAQEPSPAEAAFTAMGSWAAEGVLSRLALDPG